MLDHDEEKINRLNQQFAFIREIDKEKFTLQMQNVRRMMRNMHGIWQS